MKDDEAELQSSGSLGTRKSTRVARNPVFRKKPGFGGVFVDAFTPYVSKDINEVLQAIVILFVACEALFRGPFSRFGLLKRSKV